MHSSNEHLWISDSYSTILLLHPLLFNGKANWGGLKDLTHTYNRGWYDGDQNPSKCFRRSLMSIREMLCTDDEQRGKAGKSEQAFWIDLWVKSSFELAQWDTVQEYGKQSENFDILAQALAKTHSWSALRDDVIPAIKVSSHLHLHSVNNCSYSVMYRP